MSRLGRTYIGKHSLLSDMPSATNTDHDGRYYTETEIGAGYQPLDDVLTDLAALSVVADNEFIVGDGTGSYAHENPATARTSLGLVIGTNVQAWDAQLDSLSALTAAEVGYLDGTIAGTVVASKAVVVDASKDISSFRHITAAGTGTFGSLSQSGTSSFTGTSATTLTAIRNVAGTNNQGTSLIIRRRTSSNMVNGLGGGIAFSIQDNTAGPFNIVAIYAQRDDADNSGKLVIRPYDEGTPQEVFAFTKEGFFSVGKENPTVACDIVGEGRFTDNLQIRNNNELRFYDNSNYVGFEAPALSANKIWVLPSADGSADEIIKTDGSGTLSFVRMTKAIYAELSDSADQTFAVAGTHYSVTFNTNDEIAGITHSTSVDPENITIVTTGVYTIFAQPQVKAAAGGAGTFHMWLQNNTGGGFVDIADTNIELSLASSKEDVIPLATTFLLTAGDIIRLRVNVSDNGISLDAQAAIVGPPTEPAIPSIIFTMFMVGT